MTKQLQGIQILHFLPPSEQVLLERIPEPLVSFHSWSVLSTFAVEDGKTAVGLYQVSAQIVKQRGKFNVQFKEISNQACDSQLSSTNTRFLVSSSVTITIVRLLIPTRVPMQKKNIANIYWNRGTLVKTTFTLYAWSKTWHMAPWSRTNHHHKGWASESC